MADWADNMADWAGNMADQGSDKCEVYGNLAYGCCEFHVYQGSLREPWLYTSDLLEQS